MKSEAKQVAVLRHPDSGEIVGKLYLWNTGETDPMWHGDEIPQAKADPLEGESAEWANWNLGK